jgi:hypothetical protein
MTRRAWTAVNTVATAVASEIREHGRTLTYEERMGLATDVDAFEPVACAVCGGELEPLGTLGTVEHSRCRQCGLVQAKGDA